MTLPIAIYIYRKCSKSIRGGSVGSSDGAFKLVAMCMPCWLNWRDVEW